MAEAVFWGKGFSRGELCSQSSSVGGDFQTQPDLPATLGKLSGDLLASKASLFQTSEVVKILFPHTRLYACHYIYVDT